MKKQLIATVAAIGILASGFSTQASAHEATHTVKSGDTLYRIATNNGLTVQQLMDYNHLSSATIQVGQELSLLAPHSHSSQTYTVKAGDTLYKIANQYGITVSQLQTLNQLSSNTIYVGQILKVSSSTESAVGTYTVKAGDSLWGIANKHNLTVTQLKSLNGLTSDNIQVGQVLKTSGSTKAVPAPVKSFNVDAVIAEAKKHVGTPYVWGGTSPSGFDCSGFLHYVFLQEGKSIPRTVSALWNAGKTVSNPQVGDIVFFETYTAGPSHAGIFLGNGKFIHASSSQGVVISEMSNSYWKARYLGAKSI